MGSMALMKSFLFTPHVDSFETQKGMVFEPFPGNISRINLAQVPAWRRQLERRSRFGVEPGTGFLIWGLVKMVPGEALPKIHYS